MPAPDIKIRQESPSDISAISWVTVAAFRDAPRTSHTEQLIVDALRRSGKLALSSVATHNDKVVGHAAVSPIKIDGAHAGWYGLGPVSVLPEYQRRGIGSALVMDALVILSSSAAAGCVVLGSPAFYERFGFMASGALSLAGVPPENFMAVAFGTSTPSGAVSYDDAFDAHS